MQPFLQKTPLILFLNDKANNLALMAQGLAQKLFTRPVEVIAASMSPAQLNPVAAKVSRQRGADIRSLPILTLLDVEPFSFDITVTLGDFDQGCRPNLPGMPPNFHWNLPDPPPGTPPKELEEALNRAADILEEKLKTLEQSQLLKALFMARKNLEMVLDSLSDGVLAHTASRRIFYFNAAAERITGYRRKDILGQDCHEVFPGRFCGGDCEFCDSRQPRDENRRHTTKKTVFTRMDGSKRLLSMSIMPLADEAGQNVGALLSFKDDTELVALKTRLLHHHRLGGLVGKDPKMLDLFEQIRDVAPVNSTALILGESGTGKELVANAIHDLSPRADKPFVVVNCGALPQGILESELFGHVKGAFSGAVADKKGRFELAHQGTIFLDEVGELPPDVQVKLLRVLQVQTFERVGGERPIRVDVRVVSATNQNLKKMMDQGKFRRDLFYRLCVVPIHVPALKERRLDIPVLVEHFLELVAREHGRPPLSPSPQVLDLLVRYDWPGNVRELANAIEFAYVKCRSSIIEPEHLPPEIRGFGDKALACLPAAGRITAKDILEATAQARGNRKKAAQLLGVGRATLYRYLEQFGIK